MKKVRSSQAPIPINSCTELSETQFFPVITGGAGGLLCPFSEIAKSALILGENALIVVIYELNFSFKVDFYELPGETTGDFSLRGLFSLCCR